MIQMFAEFLHRENNTQLRLHNPIYLQRALEIQKTVRNGDTWLSNTYNTLGSYDTSNDSYYKKIVDVTVDSIKNVAKEYGVYTDNVECTDSWLNVSDQNSFQEYHLHAGNHFSAVYYINVPEDSGNIVFRSAETQTDMFPLPASEHTLANSKSFIVEPEAGDLLIFRSNVLHMVTINKSNEPRVTMAMNFIVR